MRALAGEHGESSHLVVGFCAVQMVYPIQLLSLVKIIIKFHLPGSQAKSLLTFNYVAICQNETLITRTMTYTQIAMLYSIIAKGNIRCMS